MSVGFSSWLPFRNWNFDCIWCLIIFSGKGVKTGNGVIASWFVITIFIVNKVYARAILTPLLNDNRVSSIFPLITFVLKVILFDKICSRGIAYAPNRSSSGFICWLRSGFTIILIVIIIIVFGSQSILVEFNPSSTLTVCLVIWIYVLFFLCIPLVIPWTRLMLETFFYSLFTIAYTSTRARAIWVFLSFMNLRWSRICVDCLFQVL